MVTQRRVPLVRVAFGNLSTISSLYSLFSITAPVDVPFMLVFSVTSASILALHLREVSIPPALSALRALTAVNAVRASPPSYFVSYLFRSDGHWAFMFKLLRVDGYIHALTTSFSFEVRALFEIMTTYIYIYLGDQSRHLRKIIPSAGDGLEVVRVGLARLSFAA